MTDPPDTNRKVPTIAPELSKFIESLGRYLESFDVPRIGGRMLGLLVELLQACGLSLVEQRTLGRETERKRAWGGFAIAVVK